MRTYATCRDWIPRLREFLQIHIGREGRAGEQGNRSQGNPPKEIPSGGWGGALGWLALIS